MSKFSISMAFVHFVRQTTFIDSDHEPKKVPIH
jgi:hypothetical protein